MENKNYPKWKYKIDFTETKQAMEDENWEESFKQLYKAIQLLKKKINKSDNDLIEDIERWEEDMWFEDKTEPLGFGIIKNDDDWEELEYELHNLYDMADYKKMIYIK